MHAYIAVHDGRVMRCANAGAIVCFFLNPLDNTEEAGTLHRMLHEWEVCHGLPFGAISQICFFILSMLLLPVFDFLSIRNLGLRCGYMFALAHVRAWAPQVRGSTMGLMTIMDVF